VGVLKEYLSSLLLLAVSVFYVNKEYVNNIDF
jgi:hypothetical protein